MADIHDDIESVVDPADPPPPEEARTPEQRLDRLRDGATDLENASSGSILERTDLLLWVAATLVTLGLSLVLLGWAGASGSIHVEEQIPYLISGGLLGGAIAVIGALCLVAHWLTVGIRESRAREVRAERRHAELLAALGQSPADPTLILDPEAHNHVNADGQRTQRPLRASPRRP